MELIDYKQRYYHFLIAIDQTRLIALSAGEVLKDYPNNLPSKSRKAIDQTFSGIRDNLGRFLDSESENDPETVNPRPQIESTIPLMAPIVEPALYLFVTQVLSGVQIQNFDSLLYSQELGMLLAHLEAFLSDSLRSICKADKRILHSNKKMSWDSILKAGSYEKLLEIMTEEYTYDFGWKSIKDKVAFLESEFGLSINTPNADLDALSEAEQLRHIIIHNGGRVSQEYLNRTCRSDVGLGDLIPITAEYTNEVGLKVRMLGSDVFRSVASKFFNAEEKTFQGVWSRPNRDATPT